MLGSSWLRPTLAQYDLIRYLLLVAQVVIVITSFAVVGECKATALASPDLCLSHLDHEHTHPQPAAVLPCTIEQTAFSFTHSYALSDLLRDSTLLEIIKPPPRLG